MTEEVGKVVHFEETPNFRKVTVKLAVGKQVFPGELLRVEIGENRWLIVRVTDAREINPYEKPEQAHVRELLNLDDSLSHREDLPRKFTLAIAEVLEEIEKSNGSLSVFEPHTLARVGSGVFRIDEDFLSSVLGISKEEKNIFIGTTADPSKTKVFLDPERILPRHILIVGSTGTGKSYFRGVLMEELARIGIPQINIDIHGEYNKATEELGGTVVIPGRDITIRLSSLGEGELLNLMPKLTELQQDVLRTAFLSLKRKRSEFGVDELLREIEEVGSKITDPRTRTKDLVKMRTESLKDVKIIGEGTDWRELIRKNKIINIDCRTNSQWEIQAIAGAIARELITLRQKEAIPPLIFSVDEAHMFIPSSGDSPASQVIRELIRMGRHIGIGLILITQNPMDIDKRTIKLTNTRFIFALEQDQLEHLKGVFSDTPKEIIANLPKLETGTCLMTGSRESIRHAVLVKIRKRRTTHGGETPSMVVE